MLRIINNIGPGTPEPRFCFILDNLIVHTAPVVLLLIIMAGHRYVFRAPYWPKDGPIEYVYNRLEQELNIRMNEVFCDADLARIIRETLGNIRSFTKWFHHVGYY
jgi:hypothetical protein